jgi:hypothetical protein
MYLAEKVQKVIFPIQGVIFRYNFSINESLKFDENNGIITITQFVHQLFIPLRFSLCYIFVFLTSNMSTEEWNTYIYFSYISLTTYISLMVKPRTFLNRCINYYSSSSWWLKPIILHQINFHRSFSLKSAFNITIFHVF